ncbi:hypothetical protein QQG09_09225 [Melissococcus plutonius]
MDIGIISKVSAEQNNSSDTKQEEKHINTYGVSKEIKTEDNGKFTLKGHYKPNKTINFDFLDSGDVIDKYPKDQKCNNNGDFEVTLDFPKDKVTEYGDIASIQVAVWPSEKEKPDDWPIEIKPSAKFTDSVPKKEDTSKSEDSSDSTSESKKVEEDTKDPASYNTGVTYSQLARTPDDYKDKKVKFTGDVAQVIEGDSDETQLRVRVNGKTDDIILVDVTKDVLKGSRVLENDLIEISGISNGLISYKSTIGGKITIPAISCDILNNKGKAPDGYGID